MDIKRKIINKIAHITRTHKLYRLDPLLRMLHNPDNMKKKELDQIIELDDKILFHVNTNSYLEWTLFFYGTYEPFLARLINIFVKPNDICIDIGANIGIHSVTMAKKTGPQGKVFCFEPHPTICEALRENIELNHFTWAKVVQKAVSTSSSTALLYESNEKDSNQGTASLCHKTTQSIPVLTTSLDDFFKENPISKINLIKIDVEGHEKEVINSAKEIIEHHRPIIIFEKNTHKPSETESILSFLSSKNYRFYNIHHQSMSPLMLSKGIDQAASNILALPREKTAPTTYPLDASSQKSHEGYGSALS